MNISQYADYVRTDLEATADDILIYEHDRTEDPVEIAFYLHHYVYREVEYEGRHEPSRSMRDPLDCLDMGGNCEEQVVLLTSLLESKGVPAQFIELKSLDDGYGHLTMRCCITQGDKEADAQIAELCRSTSTITDYSSAINVSVESGLFSKSVTRWYYVDPEMSRYLGDPSGFIRKGYVSETGFEWQGDVNGYDPRKGRPAKT